MKYILFFCLLLFGVMSVHSQHTFSKLLDYDSTHRQQVLNVQFIDSIYYLTSAKLGYTGIQNFYSDYAKFLKIDYDGNIMDSSEDTTITYLQETTVADSTHVFIFGFSRPYIDSLFNISVRSLATNETTVKVYSNLADGIYRYSTRHAILYGQNIILAGTCKDKLDHDRVKSFLISIDKNTLEVNKVVIYDKGSSWNSFNNVFVTKDGNLAVFSEYENEGTNNAEYRGLVIYDHNLHEMDSWYKGGYNPYRDNFKCYLTKEDIFILAQYPQKYKSEQTIMAFDLSGNKLWEFTLNWFETMDIYAIKESKSNDILIAGKYDRNLIDGLPKVGFVAKISKAGKLIWFRSISDFSGGYDSGSFQYANPASIFDFTEEDNMKITLFGYLEDKYFDVASGFIKPNSNIWMVRLDEHGCLDQDRCNYDIVLNPVNNWYIYDQINVLQKEWRYRIKDKYGHVKWTVQKFEGDTMIFDPAFDWRKYHQWVTTTSDGADTSTDTIKFRWTKEGKLNFIKPWKGFTVYPDSTMYDFALIQGDVFTLPHGFGTATVITVDSIPLSDGKLRKRLILRHDNTDNHKKFGLLIWIEGIGSPNGLLYYYDWINETQTDLLCYFDRGQRRYGIANESCTILSSIENPTIDPSNTWITDGWQQTQVSTEVRVYSFSNQDTLLNGKWYKEFFYHTTAKIHDTIKTNVFYRQEGHKVWEYDTFKERLVIDYSLQVGDTMLNEVFDESTSLIVAQRDTIFYADGKARVSLKFYCNWEPGTAIPEPNWWITFTEGICSEELLFARKYVCAIDPPHLALRCFYENNTLVYKSDHVDDCLTTSADESKIQSFRIYPNPTSDEIIIISEFDHGVLSVYHSNGQLILQKMITKTDKVDVSTFQTGLYLTQYITPNGEIIRSKFVKL